MSQHRILALFAHPDDELMSGGTLARYAASGAHVALVCATRGEIGQISEPHLATRETIAEVRSDELRAAAAALGIADVRFLGFRDSGMAGTPENDDPRSLHRAEPDEAVRRVVALIREVRPDLVITHDPTGGYGHPDHIALCRFVTEAFDRADDAAYAPEAGAAWRPARLFYGVMAKSFFEQVRAALAEAGGDVGPFSGPEMETLGYADEDITAVIDVSAQLEAKRAGFEAHRTQFGPDSPMRRLPEEAQRAMMGQEHFVLARPAPETGVRLAELLDLR
jgi:LmbE family N-acetylglucosaminyl deacetylase